MLLKAAAAIYDKGREERKKKITICGDSDKKNRVLLELMGAFYCMN